MLYLKCTSNNRATMVYEHFLVAVQNFNLPSRVRSDQGLENVLVARHMIESRGSERHSMLTGSSTHNQRIERLWRDMHSSVTLLYYRLFYHLEQQDLLDPLNNLHLWALHFVYLLRINRSLKEFILSWNNHPMRTTCHKSPQQLIQQAVFYCRIQTLKPSTQQKMFTTTMGLILLTFLVLLTVNLLMFWLIL